MAGKEAWREERGQTRYGTGDNNKNSDVLPTMIEAPGRSEQENDVL